MLGTSSGVRSDGLPTFGNSVTNGWVAPISVFPLEPAVAHLDVMRRFVGG